VNSEPASDGNSVEPVHSVTENDSVADESLVNTCCSLNDAVTVAYHVGDDNSRSLLAAVVRDVQQWALQHAYSSSWIQHFQFIN